MAVEAIILINTVPGRELELLERIAGLPGVKSAYMVYGTHDLVALVHAASNDRLKKLVSEYLRRMEGVLSTTTLVVAAKKEPGNPAF